MSQGRPPLRTIQRTFAVLDVLWTVDGAGPTEVAEQMDLPKSTVYEYLRALASTGYVVQADGKYRISYKFLSMGGRMRQRNRLFQIAKPELRKVAMETGELVNLNIEERSKSIIVHQEEGDQSLNLGTYPGMETPLHSHAAGKVLLAHLPEDVLERILDGHLEQVTDETITDPATLRTELDQIRDQGYAVDWDQQVPGMGVVSVPILIDGRLFGSIGVVCPTGRLEDTSYQNDLVRKIRETANTITVNYKYGN
ncbi:IclR family transcriptional regulator [Natrinema salifodinae]|uniref:Transcriptional regulator, IclR family n=1 Tax=Natrinema salifodinae TaxID=1202768 RepID=A0A1I0QTB7_9EURY|nr:IclR family transcriptional regulator [Natrinema salifodinae]SEW30876.1 transcriptional regulator, IclR family [Natrinema salifodinae]